MTVLKITELPLKRGDDITFFAKSLEAARTTVTVLLRHLQVFQKRGNQRCKEDFKIENDEIVVEHTAKNTRTQQSNRFR